MRQPLGEPLSCHRGAEAQEASRPGLAVEGMGWPLPVPCSRDREVPAVSGGHWGIPSSLPPLHGHRPVCVRQPHAAPRCLAAARRSSLWCGRVTHLRSRTAALQNPSTLRIFQGPSVSGWWDMRGGWGQGLGCPSGGRKRRLAGTPLCPGHQQLPLRVPSQRRQVTVMPSGTSH